MDHSTNVLIIGSGGREHALAWKAAQSPRLGKLFVAPGNAGTAALAHKVDLRVDDLAGIAAFSREQAIHLVIIGPEGPLADGLGDALREAGIRVFGPSRAAAQIEASKAFAKAFMERHGIQTARAGIATDFDSARDMLRRVDYPVVVKASGLAAGKGVIIPATTTEAEAALRRILVDREFGSAGAQVLIEERLEGDELSLLAFTDGITVRPMPSARDHKRLRDGNAGPNTGGMGAYAPAPVYPPGLVDTLTRTILQPTVDGLRAEGIPFCGVLYAGLMLTADGPRVLEFNCRFGDPETQALMPLLDSDLIEIADACATGCLRDVEVRWKKDAAACVVLAAEGYPDKPIKGKPITGLGQPLENAVVFHAGTRTAEGKIVTAGGRVLGVTGWGPTLDAAIRTAYQAVNRIQFDGMQYRRDIGGAATYASAGVDIAAGNRAVNLMRDAVRSTYGPEVLAGIGAFGGVFDACGLQGLRDPVLVASTDGVGTKVMLGAQTRRFRSLGVDMVNHCIDDILVQGARPLFFLDYVASSRLNPEMVAQIVVGMADACREAGCALLGGETAEMPGVYQADSFDIAGTLIGVAERGKLLPRKDLGEGDVIIGLASSGPHTNGYSLIRKIFQDIPLGTIFPELGLPLEDALLAPHRSYLRVLQPALDYAPAGAATGSRVKALAHITGGGLIDNIPRVLPPGLAARIRTGAWPVPPLFELIQRRGRVPTEEMYRVFNMGVGMVAIVASRDARTVQDLIGETTWLIGELVAGDQRVVLE